MAVPRPLFFMFLILSVSCGNQKYSDGEQLEEGDEDDDLDAKNGIENETEGDKGEEMGEETGEGEHSSQAQPQPQDGEDVLDDGDDEENEGRWKRKVSLESMNRKNGKVKKYLHGFTPRSTYPTVPASLENTSLAMTPGDSGVDTELQPHKRVKRYRSVEWKVYRNFCRGQRKIKSRGGSRYSCARECKRNKYCISFSFIVRTKRYMTRRWRNCYFFNGICKKVSRLNDYRTYTYIKRKYLPRRRPPPKPRSRARGWKPWGSWSSCRPSCGRRRSRKRYRKCSRGPCRGRKYQWRRCKPKRCSAKGHWGGWSSWPTCPVTCNGSTIKRSRKCYNKKINRVIKKAPCPGKSVDYKKCNTKPCPTSPPTTQWVPQVPKLKITKNPYWVMMGRIQKEERAQENAKEKAKAARAAKKRAEINKFLDKINAKKKAAKLKKAQKKAGKGRKLRKQARKRIKQKQARGGIGRKRMRQKQARGGIGRKRMRQKQARGGIGRKRMRQKQARGGTGRKRMKQKQVRGGTGRKRMRQKQARGGIGRKSMRQKQARGGTGRKRMKQKQVRGGTGRKRMKQKQARGGTGRKRMRQKQARGKIGRKHTAQKQRAKVETDVVMAKQKGKKQKGKEKEEEPEEDDGDGQMKQMIMIAAAVGGLGLVVVVIIIIKRKSSKTKAPAPAAPEHLTPHPEDAYDRGIHEVSSATRYPEQ